MKALVYYCRWQGASLRLRGRDETAVWGQFIFTDKENNETEQSFKFYLATRELVLNDSDEKIQLDEMGVVVGG